jgi:hypothetical protein
MGGLATTAIVELYLSNANVAPVVPGGNCSVPENAPEGTFLIAVNVPDLNPLDTDVGAWERGGFDVPAAPPPPACSHAGLRGRLCRVGGG